MKHKVLDLFAGIGGFSLGLEATGGFETTAFCEIDKKAQLVLKKHWPDVPIYEDIKELTYDRLKADGLVPSVITGGFPCQDISCAGKAKGILAERSGLWSEMFRLIRDVRPTWAIIENVSALRSKGLTLVLQNLCEIGYMCEWHCIPACCAAIGAPHQRDRIWIIAYSDTNSHSKPIMSEHDEASRVQEYVANPNNSGDRTSQRRDRPKIREAILQGWQEHTLSESSGYYEDVAYPASNDNSKQDGKTDTSRKDVSRWQAEIRPELTRCSEDVANPNSERLQGHSEGLEESCEVRTQETPRLLSGCRLSDFWAVEPNVGRVAHGVPKRVDRLKQLGNSVVPQIPYLLGCAILSTETLDAEEDTNAHDSN